MAFSRTLLVAALCALATFSHSTEFEFMETDALVPEISEVSLCMPPSSVLS